MPARIPKDLTPREAEDLAAQIDTEVGAEHVAKVYAEALLHAAENQGLLDAVVEEFDALVVEVLDVHPAFKNLLSALTISPEAMMGILDRSFAGRVSPLFLNFLKVLARHGRLNCLRSVRRQLHDLYDTLRGRVQVQLVTAVPLDEAQSQRIRESLQTVLGREPVIEHVVDPDVIGGAVVRVGDTLYDSTVARQLETLRQQMIDRSVHEIQSRRDRFRYPAGN
jgi:F-type H+-transporting ATPase subunit delta